MSKKQHQLNRLNHLFSALENNQVEVVSAGESPVQEVGAAHPVAQAPLPATGLVNLVPPDLLPSASIPPRVQVWSWETDPLGSFTYCGAEIFAGLGIRPQDLLGQPFRTARLHPHSSQKISDLLASQDYPLEGDLYLQTSAGDFAPVRMNIIAGPTPNNPNRGWRGFMQTTAGAHLPPPATSPREIQPYNTAVSAPTVATSAVTAGRSSLHGVAVDAFGKKNANQPISDAGKESYSHLEPAVVQAAAGQPAAMAVPFRAGEMGDMVLEVVDDLQDRVWTEDERQMMLEVANQLALALENARLYSAAQQELSERVRAEQVILHRNQDLATLNQLGQRLSSLTTRNDVYNIMTEMVGEVLDNRNLIISSLDRHTQTVSFPVFRLDGQPLHMPERSLGHDIVDHVLNSHEPLLIVENTAERLLSKGIALSERPPLSIIAIPMVAGENHLGAMVIQDFDHEHAAEFDDVHLELLSTAVAQAATALENAHLFEQMQEALRAIENRERYQGGVAQAAASLSEFGSQALPDVLKFLGHSAQASRIYLLQAQEGEASATWKLVEDWTSPMVAYLFDRSKIHNIPGEIFRAQMEDVHSNGWVEVQANEDPTPAGAYLRSQKIQTALLLNVPSKSNTASILVFDQIDYRRRWLNDEINILRVASDAIANTYVREDLLAQLQVNLDETESLYNASNRLVVSGDYQEMIAAVVAGVKSPGLNRSVMLLFEQDNYGKLARMNVQGNWYSGYGTPPSPVGTDYPRQMFERLLVTSSHAFIDDIATYPAMDEQLRQAFLSQSVASLAVLPMVSGKRQIGVLLVEGEQRHHFSGREVRTLPPLVDQLTIAVENLRLFEQTQTALAETAMLYNMSSSIAQAQEADEMIGLVMDNVLPRGATRAALFLTNLTEQDEILDLEVVGYRDQDGQSSMRGVHILLEDLPLIRMLSDEGLAISNVNGPESDPLSTSTLSRYAIGAIALVPLRSGGRLVGILTAMANKPTQFDPAEIRLLRTVGNGISVAIEKQRLLRQAQRRALELQTASEIARDTTSTLSLDLLLNRIVNLLSSRFGYASTSIYFIDATNNFAILRESTGQAGEELKRSGHKLMVGSRSVIGTVASASEPVILNDVHASPLYLAHPLFPNTRSEMALPLRIGRRVIGVLDIQSNQINAFAPEDVNVLGTLTDQVAIAIENARAYELSQKAIEDMREVDRVKSQFLANMSHELRTPLNSIIGFSRVILKGIDGPVNETQQQDLSAIYNSGQHLLMLINDILDLSKIEAGKMELAFSDVNLADLINSAMSTAVGLVKDKPIKLTTQVSKDLPMVRADSTRVRQVLINFLSNAAKFTDEGVITVEAKETNSPTGQPEVIVTVTDSGPGIAEVDRGKLFLPFSQVDDSPTRKTGGTGLGLSICRSLIELHGGRIGLLESKVGEGSTFFFTLPLPLKELSVLPELDIDRGSIILSIDDDPQVISLYQRYLQPRGFSVVAHTDPRTAVQAAREHHPIAITLDVMMPERDGWQVMQDLKNDPVTRDIPIIVCSILEEEQKGFSLGAADYLVKPFLQDELLNALNRLNHSGQIHKILVIDDDPEDLRLVQKMLEEDKKFSISQAQGGKKGWETIQANRPDAIIMDLLMPDMDGFTVLSNLRTQAALRDIPVIILTGADLTPEQHQKLDEFGKLLLSKSYLQQKDLMNTLEDALRKLRPRGQD